MSPNPLLEGVLVGGDPIGEPLTALVEDDDTRKNA